MPRSNRRTRVGRMSKAGHAKLTSLVLETLAFLKENNSWTTRTVVAAIKDDPAAIVLAGQLGCTPQNVGRRVAAALRCGARLGVLKKYGSRYGFRGTRKSVGRRRRSRSRSRERPRRRSRRRHRRSRSD